MDKIIKFQKPQRIRCLRSYTRWADKFYYCWEGCNEGIFPGQPYMARVMVKGQKLWVERRHTPTCPPDPIKEEAEEAAERSRNADKLAA